MYENSIVKISCFYEEVDLFKPDVTHDYGSSMGTGFFITDRLIATCEHVISCSTQIVCSFMKYDMKKIPCKVICYHKELDFAILRMEGDFTGEPFNIGSLNEIVNGETCKTVGYPMNSLNLKTNVGSITAMEGTSIQIDSPLNSGNSGGPLIYKDKIIGITTSSLSGAENSNLALPMDFVYKWLNKDLMKNVSEFEKLFENGRDLHTPELHITFSGSPKNFLITNVFEFSDYVNQLLPGELLEFNGIKVDNNGNIKLNESIIKLESILSTIVPNEKLHFKIKNSNQVKDIEIIVKPYKKLGVDYLPEIKKEHIKYKEIDGVYFVQLTMEHLIKMKPDTFPFSLMARLVQKVNVENRIKPCVVVTKVMDQEISDYIDTGTFFTQCLKDDKHKDINTIDDIPEKPFYFYSNNHKLYHFV